MSTAITGACGFKLVRLGLMRDALDLPFAAEDGRSLDEVTLGRRGVRGWRIWVLDPSLDFVALGCTLLF